MLLCVSIPNTEEHGYAYKERCRKKKLRVKCLVYFLTTNEIKSNPKTAFSETKRHTEQDLKKHLR